MDEKGDTIYGTVRNIISKRSALYEKINDGDKIKFRTHKLKHYKTLRFNGDIYYYDAPMTQDGIYEKETFRKIPDDSIAKTLGNFVNVKKRLPDFIITNSNDTIFGQIKNPALGKLYLDNELNEKFKIDKDIIKSYRYNNEIYVFKKKRKAKIFDDKEAYMKLVLDGNVKLYEYQNDFVYYENDLNTTRQVRDTKIYFYIEKGKEIILIGEYLYKKKLAQLFSENKNLVAKILNNEYTIDNIYLIVKYFNESK
ncbi:hypothetical protein GCM10007028_12210 [Algibacter mikhailovii]|uniref:Uncharacterized protein n=1 Tax=Algibacter mikhailovii TaxID=425498 RepID=A0A918QYQ4_9FLAO|nr:hypothetical protein GCM10007028_12210 [Algibacter mikhailovii]